MAAKRRIVYITGGMSGIGLHLAGKYAAQGCDIGLFDLVTPDDRRQEVERQRKSPDQRVRAWRADVTDNARVVAAIDEAVAEIGAPHLVINSAGIQRAAEFLELSAEAFELVVRVNLFGSRNVAQATLRHMRSGGHIAFVSSLAGLVPSYSYAAYCSSKFAVVGLASVLRVEFKPRGIDVSVICPPEIMTPLVEKELETMHPVTRELKDFAGTLTLDESCDEIMERLERREFRIIPGKKARLAYRLGRYLPDAALRGVIDSKVKKILDAQPGASAGKGSR